MKYEIQISKQAQKFIKKQPLYQQNRIIEAIYCLPFEGDIKRMAGGKSYEYRLRVGDYRILYERHDETLLILVIRIGNRGDIYKQH